MIIKFYSGTININAHIYVFQCFSYCYYYYENTSAFSSSVNDSSTPLILLSKSYPLNKFLYSI